MHNLTFTDAHDLKQARDNSLNCSIKRSLDYRLNVSKTFLLIVGDNTKKLTNGSCQYCVSKNSWTKSCARGHNIDHRSYIDYECEKAVEAGMNIIVLYKAISVDKSKCPDILKNIGSHKAMLVYNAGKYFWDYMTVKSILE